MFLQLFGKMQLNPVQSLTHRVYIENLSFNVSKTALSEVLEWCTGEKNLPIQVIRKPSGHLSMLCSAIVGFETHEAMMNALICLNSLGYDDVWHLLGPGKSSLNAKEAYTPGARRLGGHVSAPEPGPSTFPPEPPVDYEPPAAQDVLV
jgi:hypothetical protein